MIGDSMCICECGKIIDYHEGEDCPYCGAEIGLQNGDICREVSQ